MIFFTRHPIIHAYAKKKPNQWVKGFWVNLIKISSFHLCPLFCGVCFSERDVICIYEINNIFYSLNPMKTQDGGVLYRLTILD